MKEWHAKNEAGVFKAPASLIVFYFFFISLDLFTTWLVTPDLEYESNWIIKLFNLKWSLIIPLALSFAVGLSILFVVCSLKINRLIRDEIFFSQYKYRAFLRSLFSREIFPGLIVIIAFYSHFSISIIASVINFFNYIFLNHRDIFLYNISIVLVKLQTFFYPNFHYYLNTLIIVILIFSIYNKYKHFYNKLNMKKKDLIMCDPSI